MTVAILVALGVQMIGWAWYVVMRLSARWHISAAVMVDSTNQVNYFHFSETFNTRKEALVKYQAWLEEIEGDPYVIALNLYWL